MKITNDCYNIKTEKSDYPSTKIISFSDIHYGFLQQLFYQRTIKEYYNSITELSQNSDVILIPGDLFFNYQNFQIPILYND